MSVFPKVEDAVVLAMARQRRTNTIKSGEVIFGLQVDNIFVVKPNWRFLEINT